MVRDIDNYLADLTEIVESARMALILCLRARMAVSAGAQKAAYHTSLMGSLLAKIYQAGDASELNTAAAAARKLGRNDDHVYGAGR